MNSKSLKHFLSLFLILHILFIVLGITFIKTGTYNSENHFTKFWKDDEHYAKTFKGNQTLLASALLPNSRVEADGYEGEPQSAWERVTETVEFVSEVGNRGFVVVTMESLVDNMGQAAFGCPLTEFNNRMQTAGGDINSIQTDDFCDPREGFVQELDTSHNSIVSTQKGGGLFALYNNFSQELFTQTNNATSISLYASNMLREIPVIGSSSTVKAAEVPMITALEKYPLQGLFFDLWTTSRNFTYYLIIIPTVAFGFAIMFRAQINPQTQITLMRAIPRLLAAILLITFSYPIIALMLQLADPITNAILALIYSLSADLVTTGGFLYVTVGVLFSILATNGVAGLVWIIIAALFILVLIIAFIRFLLTAIRVWVYLGLLIGFGPLIILVGAFPGREDVIKNYFMNVAGQILGYIGIIAAFNLAFALIFAGLGIGSYIIAVVFLTAALGLMWRAPSMIKKVPEMMGVQPLLGGGDDRRRR